MSIRLIIGLMFSWKLEFFFVLIFSSIAFLTEKRKKKTKTIKNKKEKKKKGREIVR